MKRLFVTLALTTLTAQLQGYSIKNALRDASYSYTCPGQTYVDLSNEGIDDWQGLHILRQKFPDMLYLDLSNNNLKHIPGSINQLNSLESLDLSNNKIEDCGNIVLFVGTSSLSHFDLRGNPLKAARRHAIKTSERLQGIVIVD